MIFAQKRVNHIGDYARKASPKPTTQRQVSSPVQNGPTDDVAGHIGKPHYPVVSRVQVQTGIHLEKT
jgi:hypothetical protein